MQVMVSCNAAEQGLDLAIPSFCRQWLIQTSAVTAGIHRHGDGGRCRTRLLGIARQRRRLAILAEIPAFHDFARQGVSNHPFRHFGAVDQLV